MRPGEIFALRRTSLADKTAHIQERVYRGHLDTPKTRESNRIVTLSDTVWEDLQAWSALSPMVPEQWIFPSEKSDTPLRKDNALYNRYIRPKLKVVKLDWVDFQVMRRTYSLLRERGVDPKIVADLMGHDVDVNLNTYTQTSREIGSER